MNGQRRRERIDAMVPAVVTAAVVLVVLVFGGGLRFPLGMLAVPLAVAFAVVVMAAKSGRADR